MEIARVVYKRSCQSRGTHALRGSHRAESPQGARVAHASRGPVARADGDEPRLVVRGAVLPHPEHDPPPDVAHSAERRLMAMTAGPIGVIVRPRPGTPAQRGPRERVQGLPNVFIARAPQRDPSHLAPLVYDGTGSGQGLHRLCRGKPGAVGPERGYEASAPERPGTRHARERAWSAFAVKSSVIGSRMARRGVSGSCHGATMACPQRICAQVWPGVASRTGACQRTGMRTATTSASGSRCCRHQRGNGETLTARRSRGSGHGARNAKAVGRLRSSNSLTVALGPGFKAPGCCRVRRAARWELSGRERG